MVDDPYRNFRSHRTTHSDFGGAKRFMESSTYGEDPFLTGRMGVAYVTGLQGDDPKYYLAIATPNSKRVNLHSGKRGSEIGFEIKGQI